MKKAAIFSAVASLLGGIGSQAVAQTSVTLYGVADTGIEYVNRVSTPTAVGSRLGLQTFGSLSASRWGLRGQEDLGSGLQAYFWLENGFYVNNGALLGSQLFARQAAIGMRQTELGQLSFGRQYTSMFWSMVNFMPFLTGIAYEPAITAGGGGYREDNTVQYTGKFGPANLVAHYSFGTGFAYQGGLVSTVPNGEVPGNPRAQSAYGVGAYYLGGGFGIGTGYDQTNNALTATSPIGEDKKAFIALSYETGPVRFMGGYRWRNSTYSNGVPAIRDNFYWAGVKYHATAAVDVIAGYYYDQVKAASLSPALNATSLPNFSQVALMATYSMSKRTTLYAATAYAHNGPLNYDTVLQTGTAYGYGNPTTLTGLAPGQKGQVGATAGLRVTF